MSRGVRCAVPAAAVAAFALVAALPGCAAPEPGHAFTPHWEAYEIYGGEEAVTVVDDPTSLVAYGLEPTEVDPLPDQVAGFPTTGVESAMPVEAERELSAVLLDPLTFGYDPVYDPYFGERGEPLAEPAPWIFKPPCKFRPEVALGFVRGGTRVDVVLSFACNRAAIYKDGRFESVQDFDHARWRILGPLRRVLRDDRLIQQLK